MTNAPELGQRRKINWLNVNTVLSAAILIGAEVFGAAFAGGWAVADAARRSATTACIEPAGRRSSSLGIAVMVAFIRKAQRVEPFTRGSERARDARDVTSARRSRNFHHACKFFLHCDGANPYLRRCPISHVPVAVCRSVGIRTRGRTAA